jgi:hypothetical protein
VRLPRIAFTLASALVTALCVTTSAASAQQAPDANRAPAPDRQAAPGRPPAPDRMSGWHIAPESGAVRDMRHRLMLVATRAIGYFMSADSIEASLQSQGLSLHTDIAVLRVRLEAALDETQAAIDKGDLDRAGKSVDIAQALLDRFAAKLGG